MDIKHFVLTTILTLTGICAYEQIDSIIEIPFMGSREDGIKNANKAIEEGKYRTLVFGSLAFDDWEFEKYYKKYLKDNYRIEMSYQERVITEEGECYDSTMNKFILENCGKDIYKKSRKEAFNKYCSDTNHVFINVTEMPEFEFGLDSLIRFLKMNVNYDGSAEGLFKIYC